jgi:hypothetical protein
METGKGLQKLMNNKFHFVTESAHDWKRSSLQNKNAIDFLGAPNLTIMGSGGPRSIRP